MSEPKDFGALEGLAEALSRLVDKSRRQQKEIAPEIGISASSLSRILSGRNRPTVETLGSLLKALGCTVWDLASALDEVMGRQAQQPINGPLLLAVLPMGDLRMTSAGNAHQGTTLEDILSRVIRDQVQEHLASLTKQESPAER